MGSGTPLTELECLSNASSLQGQPKNPSQTKSQIPSRGQNEARLISRPLVAINFVRSRMFHARAALDAKGKVKFGLRHIRELPNSNSIAIIKAQYVVIIDVLNRYHDFNNPTQTVHVMKYIFPRQFGLHNVFTSPVDLRETVQPFKDYTLGTRDRSAPTPDRAEKCRPCTFAQGAFAEETSRASSSSSYKAPETAQSVLLYGTFRTLLSICGNICIFLS